MIPDQYPNYYKTLEIYTGYFDSLDNVILLSYPSSIVIMRDYCSYYLIILWCLDTRALETQHHQFQLVFHIQAYFKHDY